MVARLEGVSTGLTGRVKYEEEAEPSLYDFVEDRSPFAAGQSPISNGFILSREASFSGVALAPAPAF